MRVFALSVLVLSLSACSTSQKKASRNPANTPSQEEIKKRATLTNLKQKIGVIEFLNEAVLCSCRSTEDNKHLSNQVGYLSFKSSNISYLAECNIPNRKGSEETCDDFQIIR